MSQEDLLKRFCEESTDRLKQFSQQVLSLEGRDEAVDMYPDMMRTLHSLKGSSHILGLVPIGNVLHAIEDILSLLTQQQKPPSPQVIDVLLKTSDTLQDILSAELIDQDMFWTVELLENLGDAQKQLSSDPDDLLKVMAPHAPEIFQVLSNHQKQLLAQHIHEYKHLYEISVSLNRTSFVSDVESIHSILKEEGLLLSTTGTHEPPEPGYDLRFSFLHLSSTNPDALKVRLQHHAVEVRDIPQNQQRIHAAPVVESIPAELHVARQQETNVATSDLDELLKHVEFGEDFHELQEWFLDEGEESLKKLSEEIVLLEKDPTDENINSIFRTFHNLKGSGGSYKFPNISRIAHHLESFVDRLRGDVHIINPQAIDHMLKGVDFLSDIFDQCKLGKHDSIAISQMENEMKTLLNFSGSPAPVIPPPEQRKSAPGQSLPPVQISRAAESVRINVQKLDDIVNKAVELSITHHAEEDILSLLMQAIQTHALHVHDLRTIRHELEEQGIHLPSNSIHRLEEHVARAQQTIGQMNSILRRYEKNFSVRSVLAHHLSSEALDLQLHPLSVLFETFQRLVRDLSRSLNKQINLVIRGEEVEVDRKIIDALKDPLIHLIRNAVDHGIETPERRAAASKPSEGTITITARSLGYSFAVTIEDDGRGLDVAQISSTALKKGLASEDDIRDMSHDQIYQFIFRPGFSTRDVVTDISGRGVGMDVVFTNLKKFGGEIFVSSEAGHGTSLQLVLPCTLTLSKVLLIKLHHQLYSLPTGSVERIVFLTQQEIISYQGKKTYCYNESYVPIVELEKFLSLNADDARVRYGILLRKGEKYICLSVPQVVSEEELMTKPLPFHLRNIPIFSGANILADGTMSLFLNPSMITYTDHLLRAEPTPVSHGKKRLLVVDDSFLSRELLKNILITCGFEVATAQDGMEGYAFAKTHQLDLIVTDIEMPRMDGFELTRNIKADESLKDIPVILVSARDEEQHIRRGVEAGANAYIVKGNFNQQNLISTIKRLIPEEHV